MYILAREQPSTPRPSPPCDTSRMRWDTAQRPSSERRPSVVIAAARAALCALTTRAYENGEGGW